MKTRIALVGAVLLLTLTGCAGTTEDDASEPQSSVAKAQTAEVAESTPEATAELVADITAPGEVCDPGNMNDPICAAFYPDQAVLNITSRVPELAGVSDTEKIQRAHAACDTGDASDVYFYKAGAVSYCHQFAPGTDDQPDRYARIIAFYQDIGEDAAKEHYADRVMPTPAELGY